MKGDGRRGELRDVSEECTKHGPVRGDHTGIPRSEMTKIQNLNCQLGDGRIPECPRDIVKRTPFRKWLRK